MKKLISAAAAAVLAAAPLSVTAVRAEESYDHARYTFDILDEDKKTAVITSVSTKGTSIAVPSEIGGYKIIAIDETAFFGQRDIKSVVIPDSVISIGENAFTGCFSLESITIPDSVTELGKGCFTGCTSLESVSFGSGITRIPENCFYSCSALGDVEFPANIFCIGDRAFYGCTKLSGLYVPPTVSEIGTDAIGMHYSIRNDRNETVSGFRMLYKVNSAAAEYAEEHGIVRVYFTGDADGDDKITAQDAVIVLNEYARTAGGAAPQLDTEQRLACDLNGDKKVDARDAARILSLYAESIK